LGDIYFNIGLFSHIRLRIPPVAATYPQSDVQVSLGGVMPTYRAYMERTGRRKWTMGTSPPERI